MNHLRSSYTYIINKSKFIGYYFDVSKLKEVDSILDEIRNDHKKATHVCYAYNFNDSESNQNYIKAFDDKEPKRTAGYVILDLINKKQLKNCLIVVVRYFGGTKLGKSVLIRSYLKCANETIQIIKV